MNPPSLLQRILGANSRVRTIVLLLVASYAVIRWPVLLSGMPADIQTSIFSMANEVLHFGLYLALWFLKQNNVSGNGSVDDPTRVVKGGSSVPVSIIAALLIPVFLLNACGTATGLRIADFLQSPQNQAIIQFAGNAAGASAASALGSSAHLDPVAQEGAQVAIAALATGLLSGGAYAAAQALRTQQSTPAAANTSAIAAVVTQAGAASIAPKVSTAVAALTKTGLPPDVANEAIAAALDAVAAKTAPPAVTPPSKAVVPAQAKRTAPMSREDRACQSLEFRRWLEWANHQDRPPEPLPALPTLYTPDDRPVQPSPVVRTQFDL